MVTVTEMEDGGLGTATAVARWCLVLISIYPTFVSTCYLKINNINV